eukprot:CAMPEP_0204821380 /NCGR_PEP_ID=MMETSP1018-20131115/12148_1 /ASSEMBLY_ACC=CAM_ASM_000518 /TAXON_ID=46462 /ORGANISM="Anophryoides haemophila, Strain AH6" /LENGTH=39 /DNA_ID= /DNA_START= /DNA_END= /DNA_ORIENTATION=
MTTTVKDITPSLTSSTYAFIVGSMAVHDITGRFSLYDEA